MRGNHSQKRLSINLSALSNERVEVEIESIDTRISSERDMRAVQEWIGYIALMSLRSWEHLDIGDPIGLDPDNTTDPWMPRDVDVRVAGDVGNRCIAFLLTTCTDSTVHPEEFGSCLCRPESEIVIVLGNRTILQHVIAQEIIDMLQIPARNESVEDEESGFARADDLLSFADARTTLISPVSLGHLISERWLKSIALNEMSIHLTDDERIELNSRIHAVGIWDSFTVDISFRAWMEVDGIEDNRVTMNIHIDEPIVEEHFAPWFWVVITIILGPLGGPLMLIASRIVEPLVDYQILGFIQGFDASSIPEDEVEFGADLGPIDFPFAINLADQLPSLPFDLEISDVVLDDWSIVGTPKMTDIAIELPSPDICIYGEMIETAEQFGDSTMHSIGPGTVVTIEINNSYEGTFYAAATMVVPPISFYWYLGSKNLSGEGSVTIDETVVSYFVEAEICRLFTGVGDSLDTEIHVSAKDSRGVWLSASKRIHIDGRRTLSGSFAYRPSDVSMGPEKSPFGSLISPDILSAETMIMSRASYEFMMSAALKAGMKIDLDLSKQMRRPPEVP